MVTYDTAGKGVMWAVFAQEAMNAIFDLRWMVFFSGLLIVVDFWWGRSESKLRYSDAKTDEEREKYKFHISRAIRRSANKTVDYATYLLVGCVIGLAIMEPLGVCNHIITAALGLGLGGLSDICSIVGHICVVKGVKLDKVSFRKAVWTFVKEFLVNFFKKKNKDIGEALSETINKEDKKDESTA